METKIAIGIFGGHASEGYKRCKSYLSRRVGSEILYDIACLKFLGCEENSKPD